MSRPRTLLLVLASFISLVPQATIPAENSGPVADWRFDQTEGDLARDASGNSNDLHGAQFAKGGQGSSIRLDRLGAYAECADNTFVSTSDSDGVRTELKFAQHESAVIERIPASFTAAGPVNVLVKDYERAKLSLLPKGRGEATLTTFVGASYPDRREGVFTNGGVSPLEVGVGDAYDVTINGNTTNVQERDGILSVPLKLDGQSEVVIVRSQREGKE